MSPRFLLSLSIVLSFQSLPIFGQSRPLQCPEQPTPLVLCVLDAKGNNCWEHPNAVLQSEINLRVCGLKDWLSKSSLDPQQLTLYLNEREMVGIHPTAIDRNGGKIAFGLERTQESKQGWASLLSPPRGSRDVRVSLGPPKGDSLPSAAVVRLLILRRIWTIFALAFLAAGLYILFYIAVRKDVVRSPGKLSEEAIKNNPKAQKSYSLAKTQMLFWFAVVFLSFVVIWLVTWDRGISIPLSILGLMGVSAGTTLVGRHLDNKAEAVKKASAASGSAAAAASGAPPVVLQSAAAAAAGQGSQTVPQPTVTSTQSATALPTPPADQEATAPVSLGFWKDLTYDNGECSIQRVQIVFWTLLLGVIFLRAVWDTLAMPEFDLTLVGLMAISSTTYVSSKLPSQQT